MSLRPHINLVASRTLALDGKSKSEKKYFFKVSSSQTALTFSNCFTTSPRVQKPTSAYSRESFVQSSHVHAQRTKSSFKDKEPRTFDQHPDRHKPQTRPPTEAPRKSKKSPEHKDDLRSTDGTHSSLIREFELILSNNRRPPAALLPEIKQNKNSTKHERTMSTEQSPELTGLEKITQSSGPENKGKFQGKDGSREAYAEEMHQTILEFQNVLDNNIQVEVRRVRPEVEELNAEISKLRQMLKERDEAWEGRLNETLLKEKTLVVESFKKMLSELKKMCEWQRFGGEMCAVNEPVITSSKKLFSNYPFQHEFKNSMEEIRNTLMELKILNSESQGLRDELQNIRRALEEEREVKSNLEQELDRERQVNRRMLKELAEAKLREDEMKIKIQSLENIVRLLKESRARPYDTEYHDKPVEVPQKSERHVIEFSVSASKILRDDKRGFNSLRRLADRLPTNQEDREAKHVEGETRGEKIVDGAKAQPHEDKKHQSTFTISFRAKRKVSNDQPGHRPEHQGEGTRAR